MQGGGPCGQPSAVPPCLPLLPTPCWEAATHQTNPGCPPAHRNLASGAGRQRSVAPPLPQRRTHRLYLRQGGKGWPLHVCEEHVRQGASCAPAYTQPAICHLPSSAHLHAAIRQQLLQPALNKLEHRRPALCRHLRRGEGVAKQGRHEGGQASSRPLLQVAGTSSQALLEGRQAGKGIGASLVRDPAAHAPRWAAPPLPRPPLPRGRAARPPQSAPAEARTGTGLA